MWIVIDFVSWGWWLLEWLYIYPVGCALGTLGSLWHDELMVVSFVHRRGGSSIKVKQMARSYYSCSRIVPWAMNSSSSTKDADMTWNHWNILASSQRFCGRDPTAFLAMACSCRRQFLPFITTGTPAGGPGLWATGRSRRTSPPVLWTWSPAPAASTCSADTSACRTGSPACREISGDAFQPKLWVYLSVARISKCNY